MAFEIKQPEFPKRTFILNRALHLTADGKVVEEDDVLGVKVLGGAGKAFYEEEAKALGLDDSHRLVEETPAPVEEPPKEPEPTPEPATPPEPVSEPVAEPEPEEPKGPLPEDFPGRSALAEAGINTYAQLRKAGDVTEIQGIGPATKEKIDAALKG